MPNRKATFNALVNRLVRQYGVKVFKQGTHPQMWRNNFATGKKLVGAGAKLGPYGELGDATIFSVKIAQPLLLDTFKISKTQMEQTFIKMVINPVRTYLWQKISIWVPKMTGKLRDSLALSLTNIGGSEVRGFPFKLILNTEGVGYAGPVNKMPNTWLQHPSNAHPNKRKVNGKTYFLNDPNAKSGWFNLLLLNGRKESKKHIQDYIKYIGQQIDQNVAQFFNRTGYQLARSLFMVQYR